MSSLGKWEVFQSPEQRSALLNPMAKKVTAEQLHQFFRESWGAAIGSTAVQNAGKESSESRLILVTGNVNLSGTASTPRERILSAYLESSRVAVSQPDEKEFMAFPYLPEPDTSFEIAENVPLSDIGITRISFSNGVQLLLKPTRFKENQVLMALSFGGGKASEPIDYPGLAQFSEEVVNASGFGSMDKSELETALAGHVARIALNVGEDQFVVQGETLSTELPLLVQLLYTFVKDPGYRPEAYRLTLKRYEQMYQAMSHTVEGAMRISGQRFLAGGDSRFGFVPPEELKQLHLENIRQWFGSQLAEAPLELAVVGDIEPQKVIDLVGRYFGNLPPRQSGPGDAERPSPVFPSGRSLELEVGSSISKSMVVVAYPTDDFWDIGQTRRLNIMGVVYSERLRENIREKLGAAYSPYAYNRPYRAYPGFGLFQIFLTVAPHQAPKLIDEVKNISTELIRNGISDDEFRRAVDPTLTGIKDLRQTNTYWLNSVLVGASRHPQQLAWARTIEKDYAAINAEEIMALTRQYLDNEKMAVIFIQPKTGE
jgi:zinc protease